MPGDFFRRQPERFYTRRLLVVLLLGLPLGLSAQLQTRAVQSLADFEIHILSHIERNIQLGLHLLRKHPNEFSSLDPELVRKYLSLHDQTKFSESGPQGKSFTQWLFENYGQNFSQMDAEARKNQQAVIDELNKRDAQIRKQFFASQEFVSSGNPRIKAQQLEYLEKIVDLVDRGLDPVAKEEFNKPMKRASEFLREPVYKNMAKDLEADYSVVTQGLSFHEQKARPCPALFRYRRYLHYQR